MIVKVQISLTSSSPNQSVLIYNRSESIMYQTEEIEEVDQVKKLLKGKIKGYFKAWVKKNGVIDLREEVRGEDW